MKLEMFQGVNDEWYVRLVARNGETLMVSEQYADRTGARKVANRVAKLATPPLKIQVIA